MVGDDAAERLKDKFRSYEAASSTLAGGPSGGEPPWSPLERRVGKLEEDMGEIKTILRALEPRIIETHAAIQPMRDDIGTLKTQYGDLAKEISAVRTDLSKEISDVRSDVSEIKGMVKNLPSFTQTIIIVIAILGTVFAALSFLKP